MTNLADRLKQQARAIGFDRVGIAPATESDGFDRLQAWLAHGFAGEMRYMSAHGEARRHPASILPSVRSVVMVSLSYAPASADPSGVGKIARYARGGDYHDLLRTKLKDLLAWIRGELPETQGRGVVDTAPLLERDFARRAGLGWFGKNTMLIHPKIGSYTFLGALLVNVELPADEPFVPNHCGTCTRCLDACPTDAFVGPGQLDARRCISYLTIELRGSIPEELRPGIGDWIFGCDICQEVCPWNRKATPGSAPELQPREEMIAPDLVGWLALSDDAFRRRFRNTAILRTGRAGLLRNIAIVLGNRGDPAALPALEQAALDPDPTIREACRWAIDRIRERIDSEVAAGGPNVPHVLPV
jgi:epoxyqueuosine reductase